MIINRLPKNFFLKEEEEQKNIDTLAQNIKQMREGFMEYMNESNLEEKLNEI